jgi:adenylate kinase family enzyme
MKEKNSKIIVFITGTSGAGKSVLVPVLKEHLLSFDVRDFDELGVPEDVDLNWRLETTDYWLKIAKDNIANNKSTIISGTSIPDEIFNSSEYNSSLNIRFGLLKVKKSSIQERLIQRGWDQETIDDYKEWQQILIDIVKRTKNHRIINGDQKMEDIIEEIINWLNM